MRVLTGQPAVVEALTERSTRMRVQIDRTGSGSWVNLSDYEDRDWIDSVEYEDNGDNPVGEATVRLRREWHDLSLSPLMAQSKLNVGGVLVWPKRKIKIEVAIMPRGIEAGASDWFEVFRGRVDKIDWQRSPVELRCRDKGGDLQDGWVETQAVYGTGAGRAIESVIQDILTAAFAGEWIPEAVTLYSENGTGGTPFAPADSPGFLILEYKQGREPVMDAIQKLARLIGWECRYRWNASTSAFQLTLYEPARPVRARGTITVAGAPVAAETFAINGITYTARAAGAVTDEFNIGGTTAATATAIAAMLNAGSSHTDLNAWATGSTVIVEWQAAGTAGDAITFTEAMTNVTMDGAGTLGGTRAGAAAVVDHTFGPTGYYDVEQLSIDVTDVRNAFSGTFQETDGTRTTVTRRNDDSITKYNRRPFILTEASSSQIDTVTEMVDLLDAADNDLSEPDAVQAVLVPFFPWGEAGDYYTFSANGRHYDSAQSLAAMSLRHVLTVEQGRTVITARGKPALGPTRWLEVEGRPGVGAPPDIYTDNAAEGSVATAGVGTMIVVYDDPRTMDPPIDDWAYTECHVSASSGFTPDASTLKAVGRVTRFEVGGLTPGTTYYAKLKIIDERGNVATTSTQVSVATQLVGPYHTNGEQEFGVINPNSTFGVYTLDQTTTPPDFWVLDGSTLAAWGTAAGRFYFDTSTQQSGDRALKFVGQAPPGAGSKIYRIWSNLFTVEADLLYGLLWKFRQDGAGAGETEHAFSPLIYWYDSAKAAIGSFSPRSTILTYTGTWDDATPNAWIADRGWVTAPSTARYARLAIDITITSTFPNANHPTMYFDSFSCVRGLEKLSDMLSFMANDRTINAAAWTQPWLSANPNIDSAGGWSPGIPVGPTEHQYVVQYAREFILSARVALTAAMNAGKLLQARILNNGAELLAGPAVQNPPVGNPKGDVIIPGVRLAAGDVITLEGYHNDTVARTIDDSESYLHLVEVTETQR